jgi:hypothetical protein
MYHFNNRRCGVYLHCILREEHRQDLESTDMLKAASRLSQEDFSDTKVYEEQ